MKKTLILFICLIALPLIAHTQKQSVNYVHSKELDSLSVERRLVVLGVKSLEYYTNLNTINSKIIQTQREVIVHNEQQIAQLTKQNEGLSEALNEGLRAKKKWRKATLYSVSLNIVILSTLYVLGR